LAFLAITLEQTPVSAKTVDRLGRTEAKPLAVLVFGALNELIFALARD